METLKIKIWILLLSSLSFGQVGLRLRPLLIWPSSGWRLILSMVRVGGLGKAEPYKSSCMRLCQDLP